MRATLNGRVERRVLNNGHWVRMPTGFQTLADSISKIEVKNLDVLKKLFGDEPVCNRLVQRRD